MKKYIYAPLRETEIRLVTLLPGARLSPLCIHIQPAVLSHHETPVYEALSYTWGPRQDLVDVQVTDSTTIPVLLNLASALTHLRDDQDPRTLWIDYLSVNQEDLQERSRQVERMGDIFQHAKRVVVWLGVEEPTSDSAIQLLDDIGSEVIVDWARTCLRPQPGSDPNWANPAFDLPLAEAEWAGIYELLSRPWFERLWIQQEIRLASTGALLVCGGAKITWEHLINAVFVFRNRSKRGVPLDIAEALNKRIEMAYQIRNIEGPRHMGDLMRQSSTYKYTDERDRVYALLSHIQETSLRGKIKPDYASPVETVYQDAVEQYIRHVMSLNILDACNPVRKLTRLPSWVPDWTVPDQASVLGGFIAGADFGCVASFPQDGVLRAAGVYCATITTVIDATIEDDKPVEARTFSDIAVYLQKHVPKDGLDEPYIGGGSMFDAYCSTFCCDRFAERYHPPRDGFPRRDLSRRELQYYLEWQPGQPERPPDEDIRTGVYGVNIYWSTRGRRFFTTREGYIGLAPVGTRPGDQVCVLLGSDVPLILRPLSKTYQVIGECFICRLVDAEVLLGPLPEHHQFVYWFRDDQGYQPAFLDRSTGTVSTKDPRLEERPTIRIDKALKARGVRITDFDLV